MLSDLSNIQELRDCYPKLEEDWQNLNDADYFDKDLQVLVYGNHLICYRTFDIAYLPECSKIDAFMKMNRLSSRHKVRRVSRRSCASTESVAVGRARRRLRPIGSPVSAQKP